MPQELQSVMDQKQSPAEGVAESHLGGTQGSVPAAGTGISLWITTG